MKRKKWTEYEESTLIAEYSSLLSSGALSKLRSREKKFLPIADRVNALHHLRDPAAFPFLWSWRDVSVKIQNMRHQYLGVKHKILRPPSSPSAAADFDWDDGVNLWPNFLLYKQVFGDLDLDPDPDLDSDDEDEELGVEAEEETRMLARRVLEQGEASARRRAREEEEDWARERRRRERETGVEEERRERWRRREERREEEEMEWRERMLVMQMEHEKQVMQMQAEVCQGQMQITGILARLACQFFGAGAGGGDGGMPNQVLQGLQQEQEHSPGSLVGDDGKNDAHTSDHYL